MAIASFYTTVKTGLTLRLDYESVTQNITDNSSYVWCGLFLEVASGYYITSMSNRAWAVGNGSGTKSLTLGNGPFNVWIGSGGFTLWHNADGTRNINAGEIGGQFNFAINFSGTNLGVVAMTNSYAVALSTIPRASSVTCADFNIGSAATININRASASFTHTLVYGFGNLSGTIATQTANTSIGWQTPTDFYTQVPNAKAGVGGITCHTYSGGTLIGSSNCGFTAYVTGSEPTVTATVVDSNTATVALTGSNNTIVKGYSNALATITATAKNSATIVERTVTCGSLTASTTPVTLNNVMSNVFTVTTKDSRGYTASAIVTKTFLDYTALAFTSVITERINTTSNTINVTLSAQYFNSTFGTVANTLELKFRSKESTAAWGATYTTLTAVKSGNTFTYSGTLGTAFDFQKEYNFEFVATDKIKSITSAKTVTKGIPLLDIGKTDVNINGELKVNSASLINLIYPMGSIYMSVLNVSPATILGGTWVALQDRFLIGASSSYPVNATGGATAVATPVHRHYAEDMKAQIGASSGRADRLNYVATGATNPMTGGTQNGTYTVFGTGNANNEGFAHYTPVVGYTSTPYAADWTVIMNPYLAVYMWKRTA